MIVDKPEILKQWMTETMEPLCDAEPGKLAKYVLALIKKDMPPEQLRESMKNNLDIFLHDQAAPFVDQLFATLESKSYMPQASPDSTTQPAAAQPPAAAAAPGPEPARRRVEPEPAGRGRGDRRPISRPRDRDDRPERPERKRSWEERRRRSPPRDRRLRRSRSPPPLRVRTKSRSPPRTKSKSPAKSKPTRTSRSRSPRSPRYNRSKSPIKFDRSPPAPPEPEKPREPAGPPDLRQKLNAAVKQRCRDYDEKGFCMRGDQCPFDHGADPVILKDVSLPEVLKYSQPPPAGVPAPVAAPSAVPAPPPFNPLVQPPLPRPPIVEPYNPDAPSLTVAAPAPAPVWVPMPNYSRPPPPHPRPFFAAAATAPTRELLSVPVNGPLAAPGGLGPRPRHPYQSTDRWAGRDQNEPPRKRGHFDMGRLGGGGRPRFDPTNSSLELRKVPAGLNQIIHLNNHFAKFGKITNIQVSFNGDPEAALVTFSNPAEAKAAYKCTEAVLNNRFIKVFWHNKEREEAQPAGEVVMSGGQLMRTVTNPEVLKQQAEQQAAAKQQGIEAIKHSQQMLAAKVTLQAKQKEKQKEALKLAADLKKRNSDLLEKQLSQQKALLVRLESKTLKPEERSTLITTVKSLQEAIVQTRAVIFASMEREPSARGKDAAEREVLDAEMDLYQKQQAGVDTSELQQRVIEMRQQLIASRGRGRGRGRAPPTRGRGRGRGGPGFAVGHPRPTTVDRRPTKLTVSGYQPDEKTALLAHLAQFGEIVDYKQDAATPSVVVTFRARQGAEAALSRGRQFNDRQLTVAWCAPPPAAAPATPAAAPTAAAAAAADTADAADAADTAAAIKASPDEAETELLADDEDDEMGSAAGQPDDLLAADEEDEEDNGERSWRR